MDIYIREGDLIRLSRRAGGCAIGTSRIYYLDLQTLEPYLRDKSAHLKGVVPFPKSREVGYGSIFLKRGVRVGCFLHSHTGLLLSKGEVAYQALIPCRKWEVCIETEQEVEQALAEIQEEAVIQKAALPSPLLLNANSIPRQRRPLDETLLEGLSTQQRLLLRTVLVMVNGRRTVAQIQARLHFLPRSVEEALSYLCEHFIIEIE